MSKKHIIYLGLKGDPTFEYILRVGYHDDEISIILRGHLLVEYLINKIIQVKCKNPEKILSYPFSIKLQIVYSMKLLPDYLYKNIAKINNIRNGLVHNLNFNNKEIDMKFLKSSGECVRLKPKGKKNPRKFYLKMLSMGTLTLLRNYMIQDIGVSPKLDKNDSIFA